MTLNSLRLTRNILLRSFVIGYGVTVLMSLITYGAWDTWSVFVIKLAHVDQTALATSILNVFGMVKIFLLFIFLTPALAIHWTIKRELSGKAVSGAASSVQNQLPGAGPTNIAPQH